MNKYQIEEFNRRWAEVEAFWAENPDNKNKLYWNPAWDSIKGLTTSNKPEPVESIEARSRVFDKFMSKFGNRHVEILMVNNLK